MTAESRARTSATLEDHGPRTFLLLVGSPSDKKRTIGTAWFLDDDVVITALHVVGKVFPEASTPTWTHEYVVDCAYDLQALGLRLTPELYDARNDLATLRVATRQSEHVIHLAERLQRKAPFEAPGYQGGESISVIGSVVRTHERKGADRLQLYVKLGTDIDWGGMSGAPVLVDDRACGLLLSQFDGASTLWAAELDAVRRMRDVTRLLRALEGLSEAKRQTILRLLQARSPQELAQRIVDHSVSGRVLLTALPSDTDPELAPVREALRDIRDARARPRLAWSSLAVGVLTVLGLVAPRLIKPPTPPVDPPVVLTVSNVAAPPDMSLVQGATFMMGTTPEERKWAEARCDEGSTRDCSEKLDREVERNVAVRAFFIDKTEVSVKSFAAWLDTLPTDALDASARRPPYVSDEILRVLEPPQSGAGYIPHEGYEDLPVTGVTWFGAAAYCAAQEPKKRLPTEAEWELAARGPGRFRFPWGQEDPCTMVAVVGCCQASAGKQRLAAVNDLPTSDKRDDVLRLAGNVSEWTADAFQAKGDVSCARHLAGGVCFAPFKDGGASELRSVRGGDVASPTAFACRGAFRGSRAPHEGARWLGFRCARDVP